MLVLLVIWAGLFRLGGAASVIAGDTYSCFTNFQAISTEGCLSRIETDDGSIVQSTLQDVENMDFCVSGPSYGQTKQGSFGKAKNYVVSTDLKMIDLGKYSASYGFLGIAFNMMDSKNYDIAYVRPHAKNHCWELGYVENGLLFGRDFGTCSRKLNSEFNLAVHVENGKGAIYIDGAKESEFTPFFPPSNKVATAMRNNMKAQMQIRNLEVCQEINCVSRSPEGKVLVTKPLDSYTSKGMSECEACTCQLYGMIKCGCRSAAEQGVTCSSDTIPAVGHDCCARCVPPSATCYASGDPHYKSFDNRYYDFQGKCTYCLAKTLDFEVRHKNFGGGSVSYNEYCQLIFDGDQYEMRTSLNVTPRDGTEATVATPFKKHYNSQDYVYCRDGTYCEVYIKNQKMLSVQCAERRAVTLWIHGTYYEKTECMCGSWNGNPSDDFKDETGAAVSSPNEMAEAFRRGNDDGCPAPPEPVDPCDEISREQRNWAEQYCSRYKQAPFKSCPVDVTQAFSNCMFDACMEPDNDENVCQNAATYAEECSEAGHPVIGWRSSTFCPLECKDTFRFMECGAGCWPTCDNPAPADCSEQCVEGCYCPPGTVLQDGQCIESSDCKCMFEGQFYENEASWNDTAQCETCSCQDGGIVDCDPMACPGCPSGQVPVTYTGSCCPTCLADWAEEEEARIELTEQDGPASLVCELHDDVLVSPDDVTWKKSNGDIVDPESLPDNYQFSDDRLTLTINPAYLGDDNDYTAEVVYNGVVGSCRFDLVVNPIPPVDLIDIDGDSPRTVIMGECQTLSVKVVSDDEFEATDFVWTRGHTNRDIDFERDDSKFSVSDDGKTITVCDADDDDEGPYQCCVTKDDNTDCVDIELQVIATCQTDERVYEEEDTWEESDHESCICTTTGDIECECKEQDVECEVGQETYFDETCQKLCTRKPANCLVTGDPHYKTFDGERHDFQGGDCRFTLVKTDDFEVIGTNKHRNDKKVSWNEEVEIVVNGLTIHLGQENVVSIGDSSPALPYKKSFMGTGEMLSVSRAGESIVVKFLSYGVEALDMVWDGNSTVSMTLHGKYYGETAGLCGSWDEDPDNDLNDMDVNDFGWSHKQDEQCEEEPQPPHPCDESFFPEAIPLADETCDKLLEAPFSSAHELVDVETAVYNCKFDVCSCWDPTCACPSVKQYVKEAQNAGVASLASWRDAVPFCPLDCPEGLVYNSCGPLCEATCADKDPDCGKLQGQCNEGCFCPQGTYRLGEACVAEEECKCEFQGQSKEVGAVWEDHDICKDCVCRTGGEVVCEPMQCANCPQGQMPVYSDDECCPECVEDWLWAEKEVYEDVKEDADVTISCESVIKPKKVTWYSSVDGEAWTKINKAKKLSYTITPVAADTPTFYKCEARHDFKTKSAVIRIEIAEAGPKECTAAAPENGAVDPKIPMIGDTVTYRCEDGFELNGEETGLCQEDGTIDNTDVTCTEAGPEQLSFGEYEIKPKKNKATLACAIQDGDFDGDADVKYYWVDKGKLKPVGGEPVFSVKKGASTYTLAKVKTKKKPKEIRCIGTSADGSKTAEGTITLVGGKKKKKKSKGQ